MAKVYVLMEHIHYEGSTILGIFSTADEAEIERKKYESTNEQSDVRFEIHLYTIDKNRKE